MHCNGEMRIVLSKYYSIYQSITPEILFGWWNDPTKSVCGYRILRTEILMKDYHHHHGIR